MNELFIYPLFPATILAIATWFYWKRNGFPATFPPKTQVGLNFIIYYVGFYLLTKLFLYGNV